MLLKAATVAFAFLVGYALLLAGFWQAGKEPPSLWGYPWFWALFAIAVLTPARWWMWDDLNPFDDFSIDD